MKALIKVTENEQHQQVVSARELHRGLSLATRFSKWVTQNFKDFVEGTDFTGVTIVTAVNNGAQQTLRDYAITIDMAKNLALMSRTEKGAEYRAYLIDVERRWNDPGEIVKRGYAILQDQNTRLKITNNQLSIDNQMMKPKADYFDKVVQRNTLTNFRDTAKMLGKKQKEFIGWLLQHKYVYRDAKHKLKPKSEYTGRYFVIKDNYYGYPQTLITPEGRQAFNLLTREA
jgi:anti-repressor protein